MENQKLNIQTFVAVFFIFILVAAAITTVFGQEKKEHTKIVQLKITEDENGVVTSIDTSFVMEQNHEFEFDKTFNTWLNRKGDSMNVNVNMSNSYFNLLDIDSLMSNLTIDFQDMEDGRSMMFITDEMDETLKGLDGELKTFSYNFDHVMSDGDSTITMVINTRVDDGDTLIEKQIKRFGTDTGDKNVFIFSDGKEIKIDEDGEVKVIRLGDKNGAIFTGDTIIESGNAKFIIKTDNDGDNTEQTIEYISVFTDEDHDEDVDIDGEKEVIIIKKDGSKKVWIDGDEEVYVLGDTKYEFLPAEKNDLEALKDAGVKTKNRELEVENLKFSPNPSNGKFNLSFTLKEKKKVTINIYDMSGNIVYTETIKDFQGEYYREIDISNQESGAYFLQIVQGLYDIIKKIIIQ